MSMELMRQQIVRLMEDGLNKVELNDRQAQRLIEHGDELQEKLKELLAQLSVSGQFAYEEVASSYVYPSWYAVRGITEQTNRLRELFPGLGTANEKLAGQPLPAGAEARFAIPSWEKIAPTYNGAVEKILALISETRGGKCINHRQGELGLQYLRQHQRTITTFNQFDEQQKDHDMLVVPAQFGLRHRGRSVRRAHEVFAANECGLGAFAIGIMLLTHPERLQLLDDLWVDCAGDEYAPGADGRFLRAPYFYCFDGRIKFDARVLVRAGGRYGSASAFLPQ